MRTMEFSGRTVDEAIFHGLTEMGLSIDEVDVETVQTASRGIFGIGSKSAVVRLTEREVKAVPVFDTKKSESAAAERSDDRPPRRDGRRDERRGERSDGRNRKTDEAEPVSYPYSRELAESLECTKFLQGLLDQMGIEARLEACETDDGIRINMISETDGLLIGRRGETLDAIQYIVSLYANKDRKEKSYQRITIDTEGYRSRREQTLKSIARRNAVRVIRTGRPFRMEPMNPYERRVVHSALADFRGVTTHSEGEEPNRRVIITSKR
ncbi:MAG: RNA-binding cell elongation regulator Jag/EloR [Clostridia bacterium]|nr:RNA-binding cell elongation regulator Jag/EloR [Clostridia bacterium]